MRKREREVETENSEKVRRTKKGGEKIMSMEKEIKKPLY